MRRKGGNINNMKNIQQIFRFCKSMPADKMINRMRFYQEKRTILFLYSIKANQTHAYWNRFMKIIMYAIFSRATSYFTSWMREFSCTCLATLYRPLVASQPRRLFCRLTVRPVLLHSINQHNSITDDFQIS